MLPANREKAPRSEGIRERNQGKESSFLNGTLEPSTPRTLSRRGFTLLEVMISLAIVGGLLVTLLYTLNYHLGIAARHEAATVATMLGREKLIEVRKKPGSSEGTFEEPFTSYSYKAEVKSSPFPGIAEISVTVTGSGEKVLLREFIRGDVIGTDE